MLIPNYLASICSLMLRFPSEIVGVDVDNMSEIEWKASPQEVMKRLILPERDIEMIQALSQTFQKGQPKFWGADFVAGKGEGQIFLLHGTLEDMSEFIIL